MLRKTWILLLVCGSWSNTPRAHAQTEERRSAPRAVKTGLATLSIAVQPSSGKRGVSRVLSLELRNVSKVQVFSPDLREPMKNWVVTIRDGSGAAVPLSAEGTRRREQALPIGITTAILGPGESLRDEIEISKMFDLSRPGVYSHGVTRETSTPDPVIVKSYGSDSVWTFVASEDLTFEVLL